MTTYHKPTTTLRLRGNDPTGYGHFGASRSGGKRKHNGTDYCADEGEPIFAVISGKIRIGYPYKGQTKMKLVEITQSDTAVKIMYVEPKVRDGQNVQAGEIIGYAQNVAKYWNSNKMKNHIHVEIRIKGQLVDPEQRIKDKV
ncbi:M23 family metallopeptidase [Capnocytophaga canimorsus]|uniref:M23 family metallopeptidase n=1 Tax=Capnocytophaga canimorsus TaxID=28188 RepID=UPI0028E429BD|nr:M23 family metallopeptidase [Capnocytophaga canimorsus]MDT9499131.1 M23 family metallopeptidase [Capnocytophaga canimorsus]